MSPLMAKVSMPRSGGLGGKVLVGQGLFSRVDDDEQGLCRQEPETREKLVRPRPRRSRRPGVCRRPAARRSAAGPNIPCCPASLPCRDGPAASPQSRSRRKPGSPSPCEARAGVWRPSADRQTDSLANARTTMATASALRTSARLEGVMPPSWSYSRGRSLKSTRHGSAFSGSTARQACPTDRRAPSPR